VLVDEKNRPIGIVTEFLEGGDLEGLLHPEEGTPAKVISLDTKIGYAIDICLGMSWLMGKDVKIIHRDLKPANIMLDKGQVSCKICDFGLAVTNEKTIKGKQEHVGDIRSTRGSPLWMAPERVAIKIMGDDELKEVLATEIAAYTKSVKVDKTASNSSEKSDVYSFGVMLWEMATQQWPFVEMLTSESFTELFSLILSGKRPSLKEIDQSLASIIEKCWQNDPVARPTFESVIEMLRGARIDAGLPNSVCPQAATFWKKARGLAEPTCTIGHFVEGLESQSYLKPQKTSPSQLKAELVERSIATLLGSPGATPVAAAAAREKTISMQEFAKLLKWFGPMQGSSVSCFHHMVEVLKQPWFFGPIERQQSERLTNDNGVFIVRLNTGGSAPIESSPFVISTLVKKVPFHIRVLHQNPKSYGKWSCSGPAPANKKFNADSLSELIADLTAAGILSTAAPSSPYLGLFTVVASAFQYTADLDIQGSLQLQQGFHKNK